MVRCARPCTRSGAGLARLRWIVSDAVTTLPESPSSAQPATPWLGENELLVHIGVHKTGTTAIQNAFAAARNRLCEQGVRYPGEGADHFVATNAFFGRARGSNWARSMPPPSLTRWTKLVKEVQRADAERVVISSEALCECKPAQIKRFIDAFDGRPLRVIATFRPLETLMPSNWQQYLKAGNTFTFDEWLRATLVDPIEPKAPTPSFWMRNDHPSVLERWADVVGHDRVAALVVDPHDRSMLFRTFEQIVGVASETLTPDPSAASNRGLSAEEVEFLRQFNASLDREMDFRHYHTLFRRAGLLQMVEQRSPGSHEHPIVVPAWAIERAREIGAAHVERIGRMGVTVFGDLDHLVPTTPVAQDAHDTVILPTNVPIDAAVQILRGTLMRSIARIERLESVPPSVAAHEPAGEASSRLRSWVPPALVPFAKRMRGLMRTRRPGRR